MKKNSGFTLIEILIALFILAIIGALVARGLQTAMQAQNRSRSHSERLSQIQSAVLIMERDFLQMINRPIIDRDGTKLPAFMTKYVGNQLNIEFTHAGFSNPFGLQNRSTLQRVSYSWNGKDLLRTTWQELDRTENTPQGSEILLPDVKAFNIRLLDEKKQLLVPGDTTVQAPDSKLPLGIELNIELNDMGIITRFIPLLG